MKNTKYLIFGTLIMGMVFAAVLAGCASTVGSKTPPPPDKQVEDAAKLVADLNAIKAGSATVEGATVTLSSEVRLTTGLTVPAGVTLDLTKEALKLDDNAPLTVNGTVDTKNEGINIDSEAANPALINGSGTINLKSKGHLLRIWQGKKLTLDGVTLAGLKDNDTSLVRVGEGGELVLKSGAITGNTAISNDWSSGGGVFVGEGSTFTTITMNGGRIQGSTDSDGFAKNIAASGAAIRIASTTAKWGIGGTYTKGGVSQLEGNDITTTDYTLIAIPTP
jgi:hypothetical protein